MSPASPYLNQRGNYSARQLPLHEYFKVIAPFLLLPKAALLVAEYFRLSFRYPYNRYGRCGDRIP